MAHQTLRRGWFGITWFTKYYKYTNVRANGSPNIMYTLVSGHMAHQTMQIQWFDGPLLTKLYVYNGLLTHGSPNLTNKFVRLPTCHQALHIQWCGDALLSNLTNRIILMPMPHSTYVYSGLEIHGSPNSTKTMV